MAVIPGPCLKALSHCEMALTNVPRPPTLSTFVTGMESPWNRLELMTPTVCPMGTG
jgi:hypothetical protein